ncbi:hypothetical protein BU15DRAFT_60699 [Melanogaster broomeanus]|nr:hypothetical protein BU15DRAFT_60699 [Melanogaster broomeanus]
MAMPYQQCTRSFGLLPQKDLELLVAILWNGWDAFTTKLGKTVPAVTRGECKTPVFPVGIPVSRQRFGLLEARGGEEPCLDHDGRGHVKHDQFSAFALDISSDGFLKWPLFRYCPCFSARPMFVHETENEHVKISDLSPGTLRGCRAFPQTIEREEERDKDAQLESYDELRVASVTAQQEFPARQKVIEAELVITHESLQTMKTSALEEQVASFLRHRDS